MKILEYPGHNSEMSRNHDDYEFLKLANQFYMILILLIKFAVLTMTYGKREMRRVESAYLPQLWPGLDSKSSAKLIVLKLNIRIRI